MESELDKELSSMLGNEEPSAGKDKDKERGMEDIGTEDTEESESSEADYDETDETDSDDIETDTESDTEEEVEERKKKRSKKSDKGRKKKKVTKKTKTEKAQGTNDEKTETAPKTHGGARKKKVQPKATGDESEQGENAEGEGKVAGSGRSDKIAAAKGVLQQMGLGIDIPSLKVELGRAISVLAEEVMNSPSTMQGKTEAIIKAVEKLKTWRLFSLSLQQDKKSWGVDVKLEKAGDTNVLTTMLPRYNHTAGNADNVICFMHALVVCAADRATAAKAQSSLDQAFLLKTYLAPYQNSTDDHNAHKQLLHTAITTNAAISSVLLSPGMANSICGGKDMKPLCGMLDEHEISSYFDISTSPGFRNAVYTVPATSFYTTLLMMVNTVARKMVAQGEIAASMRSDKRVKFSLAFAGMQAKRQRNGKKKHEQN